MWPWWGVTDRPFASSLSGSGPLLREELRGPARPDVLTRLCLLAAAVLPWYAVFSGVFGLYSYVLLLAQVPGRVLGGAVGESASDVLFVLALLAALPLGLLLLALAPAGLAWAAFRRPPAGLAVGVVRVGCVVQMALAAFYAGLIALGFTGGLWQQGLLHAVVLLCGLAATWRVWRWLRTVG